LRFGECSFINYLEILDNAAFYEVVCSTSYTAPSNTPIDTNFEILDHGRNRTRMLANTLTHATNMNTVIAPEIGTNFTTLKFEILFF